MNFTTTLGDDMTLKEFENLRHSLKTMIPGLYQEIDSLNVEKKQLESNINSQKSTISSLERNLNEAEEEIINAQNKIGKIDISKLQHKINLEEKTVIQHQSELKEFEETYFDGLDYGSYRQRYFSENETSITKKHSNWTALGFVLGLMVAIYVVFIMAPDQVIKCDDGTEVPYWSHIWESGTESGFCEDEDEDESQDLTNFFTVLISILMAFMLFKLGQYQDGKLNSQHIVMARGKNNKLRSDFDELNDDAYEKYVQIEKKIFKAKSRIHRNKNKLESPKEYSQTISKQNKEVKRIKKSLNDKKSEISQMVQKRDKILNTIEDKQSKLSDYWKSISHLIPYNEHLELL